MKATDTKATCTVEAPADRAIQWIVTDGGRADSGYRGSADDCVVRAIAIADGRSYQQVYDEMAVLMKRKTKKVSARDGVPTLVWEAYLRGLGYRRVDTFAPGKPKMKMRAEDMPAGATIICHMRGHLAAVVDQVLHDTYDCSEGGDRRVLAYWIKR